MVTPPTEEPITAETAKLHTRVGTDLEDALIDLWIESGRIMAEGYQNRSFVKRTMEALFDTCPPRQFELTLPPIIEVDSITFYDEDEEPHEVDNAEYYVDVDSGRIALKKGKEWPDVELRPMNAVVVRYKAGHGTAEDVPKTVKDALLTYVTYRYYNREAEGSEPPPQFYWLLAPDRRWNA